MKMKSVMGGAAALLLGLAVAWYFGLFGGDPALAELNRLRAEIEKNDGPPTEEQRAAMRAQMDQLTDAQRRQFWSQNRPEMQARMTQRMNEFMSRPPEVIRKELASKVIAGRAERAKRDANGQGGGGDRGGGNRGDRPQRTEAEQDQRAKERLDRFPPEGRAQFSQLRGMVNKELEARGEEPLGRGDMRQVFGAIMGDEGGRGGPGGGRGGGGPPR